MKRRLLIIAAVLALVMSMIPASVFAAEAAIYPVKILGERLSSDYMSDPVAGWEYDPETNTLTLKDCLIEADGESSNTCILFDPDEAGQTLTIVVSGGSTIRGNNAEGALGIEVDDANLVITGDAGLTIQECGIAVYHSSIGNKVTVKNADLTINRCQNGIVGGGDLLIDNATVDISDIAVGLEERSITIKDSTVTAITSLFGIFATEDKISISGNSTVTAECDPEDPEAVSIASTGEFDLQGVEITEPEGGQTDGYEYGNLERYFVFAEGSETPATRVVIKKAENTVPPTGNVNGTFFWTGMMTISVLFLIILISRRRSANI